MIKITKTVPIEKALKKARLNKGLTQDLLSMMTGVPQHTISRFEKGIGTNNYGSLSKLIKTLEIGE